MQNCKLYLILNRVPFSILPTIYEKNYDMQNRKLYLILNFFCKKTTTNQFFTHFIVEIFVFKLYFIVFIVKIVNLDHYFLVILL